MFTYSEDLRLEEVWLHFFLRYDTEEMTGLLAMSVWSVESSNNIFSNTFQRAVTDRKLIFDVR